MSGYRLCYNSKEEILPVEKMAFMKQKNTGFTIVEVMIFLAVSGILLVSALLLVNGQQNRTEFATAVRDIESQVRDVINDVSTGVYNYNGDFTCQISGTGTAPVISSGSTEQGSNLGCTFIGRVFQFSPLNDPSRFYIYSVAGRQFPGSGPTSGDIYYLWDAKPVAISPRTSSPSIPDATERVPLTNGLRVEKMTYNDGAGDINIGAFGIFSNFTRNAGGTSTIKQNSDFWPIHNSVLNEGQETAADKIYAMGTPMWPYIALRNPTNGISICFVNDRVSQHGLLTIGNQSGRLNTNLSIGSGSCP